MRLTLRLDKIVRRHDNGPGWVLAATAMERTNEDLDGYSTTVVMVTERLE